MAWQISQLMVDFQQNRGIVSLTQQASPTDPNSYMNVNVQFGVADKDQQREGVAEAALKARAKQVLMDAANSL